MTILGIDPGYDRLGWAIARQNGQNWTQLKLGCIQTDKTNDLFQRYVSLDQQLQAIIDKFKPQRAAIESLFFFKNKKTALKVSEARGVVISNLIKNQLEIVEYTPLQIKQTVTGYGRADKKAVEKMIRLEFNLKDDKIIDDAIDALAVILTDTIQAKNKKYYA